MRDLEERRQENEAREKLETLHEANIKQIKTEEESLKKNKEELEARMRDLEERRREEEEFMKRKDMITRLVNNIEEGEQDNETILKINTILEEQKRANLISKSLYLHVKEALIDTAVENISKLSDQTESL